MADHESCRYTLDELQAVVIDGDFTFPSGKDARCSHHAKQLEDAEEAQHAHDAKSAQILEGININIRGISA